MISTEKLDSIFEKLKAYRGTGREDLLWDSRDKGNYGAYSWDRTKEMLRRADASGVAEALLLHEMAEATIIGSQVVLGRVLREEGFLDSLKRILDIHREVENIVGEPRKNLMASLETALARVSENFGAPTSREVAICMRDAIYCLDKGLTMRWLVCGETAMAKSVPISHDVRQFANIAEFVDALRTGLPFGAHLARIGTEFTAIGVKQPGRIAYLSSMGIDIHRGKMAQNRANGHHMAEAFDLDTPVERYPEWTKVASYRTHERAIVGRDTHEMNHISTLPRDRLIWLAMVVDMATQRMANTDAASIALAETLANALPGRVHSALPVIIKPNWVVDTLTLDAMMASLGFSEWETRFLQPALERLSAETFLPESDKEVGLRVDTRTLCEWPPEFGGSMGFSQKQDIHDNAVRFVRVAEDWVGSKAEIDAARRRVFGHNLVEYLMEWGNRRFVALWESERGWFKEKLQARLKDALRHRCIYLKDANYNTRSGVHLYEQSKKHKTYNPRCIFNSKSEVTDALLAHPESAADIVELLGLKSEGELPEALRGWKRTQGWATTERHPAGPYGTNERWVFRRRHEQSDRKAVFEATVCVSRNNFDVSGIPAQDNGGDD